MDYKFGVLLVIVAHICTIQALPPCVCTRNYRPVCGSDGHTYSNECLMACANKDITPLWEGRCEDPPAGPETCICPLIYLPVCGNDGVTYPSRCNLDCVKQKNVEVEMSHEGACESITPQEPPCICTKEKKPVCGSDGATYSNACLLNCATKDNHMLSIEHSGPCNDKVKVVENLFH